jgi:hypothetical protein
MKIYYKSWNGGHLQKIAIKINPVKETACVSGRMDAHALNATVGLLRGQVGRNVAFLARCEFRDLRPPPDWTLIMRLGRVKTHPSPLYFNRNK